MQIIETSASMATVEKMCSQCFSKKMDFLFDRFDFNLSAFLDLTNVLTMSLCLHLLSN